MEASMTPLKFTSTGDRLTAVACVALAASIFGACSEDDEKTTNDLGTTRSELIEGPEGDLFVTDGGNGGLAVVFVHSFAGSSEHWAAQLDDVRGERRAIAFDLRGHGKSDAPSNDDYSVDALSSDLEAVVDAKGVDRFVLVGHSMGGSASIRYAGTHPDRVAGLMLVGTPGKADADKAQQTLTALNMDYEKTMDTYWQSLVSGAKPAVADKVITAGKNMPRDPSMAMIDAVFAYDPLPALAAYDGPKLLVDTPHGQGPDSLHSELPELRQVMIAGTSHWPQLDKPQEFNEVLDQFLRDTEKASGK
jgi:pimeloyl-ACP methyl ester carboxylesterase